MYWKLLTERLAGGAGSARNLMRSGMITGSIVALLVVAAGVVYYETGKGNYAKLKRHLGAESQQDPSLRPGGQDPVVLTHVVTPGTMVPEFLSATLLPGRGMQLLQLTAYVPGQGEVSLLAGGDLAQAAPVMTGKDDDLGNRQSLTHGAAILSPWAGSLGGVPSIDGKSASVPWHGQIYDVPANNLLSANPQAYGGLLLTLPSTHVETEAMPDGGLAAATFSDEDYDRRWPSRSETTITCLLAGRSVEISVTLKNTGTEAMPAGIGWAPRFVFPGNPRSKLLLHVPATERTEKRAGPGELPSGKLLSVTGTPYDFTPRAGVALGDLTLNDTYVHLNTALDQHPALEIRDPQSKTGLRVTALTSSIHAVRVYAPADANFVSVSPQTNLDDPFGKEWQGQDTGMVTLAPGQTLEWKIRLEIFALVRSAPQPL